MSIQTIKNNFLNWKKYCISFLAFIIISTFSFCLEYIVFKYDVVYSKTRVCIYLIIYIFLLVNIWWDYRKLWKLIHKYRYFIALIIFAILVALGVNTSSAGIFNQVIQPNTTVDNAYPFWGVLRSIRSDEFLGGSPTFLSQAMDGTFAENNNLIMATLSPLTLQPKVTTLNISVLASPQLLGYFVFGPVRGFAFSSLFPIFAAFMATYEMLRLLTYDKRVLSVCATCVIVFSPVVLWWGCYQYVTYGFICIVLFDKILACKIHWKNILLAIAIGWSFACYVMSCYPAWMIPYGYLYLFVIIGLLIERRKDLKIIKFVYLIFSLLVVVALVVPAFITSQSTALLMSQTVYPGERNEVGGTGWQLLFNWLSSVLFSWQCSGNVCELSSFISLYPLPFIVAIVVLIRGFIKKDFDSVLLLIVVIGVLLSLWNYFPNEFIGKITLLYMCPPGRTCVVVELACCLILFRILATCKFSVKKFSIKRSVTAAVVAIGFITLSFFIVYEMHIVSTKYLLISCCVFAVLVYLLLYNSKISRHVFLAGITSIGIFCFITVQPFTFGLNSFFEKSFAKEVQSEVAQNRDEIWASLDDIYMSNYALANGARVLNSVNYYPNLELWHRIDPTGTYEEVYNRYAHVTISLVDGEQSSFELLQADSIKVNLTINDVKKLGITRLVSHDTSLENKSNENCVFTKSYEEDGISIYKVT